MRALTASLLSILLVFVQVVTPVFAAVGTSADIQIAPPTNVVGTPDGAGGVVVTWDASPHEASGSVNNYKVQYKLTADSVWLDVVDAGNNGIVYPPDQNTYTISGLTIGESYDVHVIAVSKYDDTLSNTIISRIDDTNAEDIGVTVALAPPPPKIITIPSSTINISAGTTITNWSAVAGSATLTGNATSNGSALLLSVKVSIQNTDNGQYWGGTAWQGGSVMLDAAMVDGAINGTTENWEYLGVSELDMSTGNYLVSVTSTSQDATQTVPTTVSFQYEMPITSSFAVAEGSDLLTFSDVAGSATLSGAATTASDTITTVQITLQRSSDGLYWHGSAWQAGAIWLDTTAIDGAFNTGNETWEYLNINEVNLTAGETYALTPRAEKTGAVLEATPISHAFSYQKTLPNIGAITAGPSTTDRVSIASSTWMNHAMTGDDALISFSWSDPSSAGGNTFYYVIDTNNAATSIAGTAANATAGTNNAYLDLQTGNELTAGTSYLHVQPQNNADGVWGIERVFEINYDPIIPTVTTANAITASGEYTPGTTIDFTITFSEPVTAPTDLIVHFDSGGTTAIPAFTVPTSSITGTYTIGTFENSAKLYIQLIEGILVDHANNTAINAVPITNMHASAEIAITSVRIDITDPTPENEQYVTVKDTITFQAKAPSATRMRVSSSSGFATADTRNTIAFDSWVDYVETDITLVLSSDLGARILTVEFENGISETRTVHAIITRLGTKLALVEEIALQEELIVGQETAVQESAAVYLPTGTDLTQINPALLDGLNQAIDTGDADAIQAAADRLLAILHEIEILRALLLEENTTDLITQIIPFLNSYELNINLIFSINEINTLLALLTPEQTNMLMLYLDPSMITLDIDPETLELAVVEQPLSIRDTDGDGLSDLLELEYGTNPYLADTDGDGYADGMEILDLGTDPTVFDGSVATRFTNVQTGMTFNDPTPIIRGTGVMDVDVIIVAIASDGSELILGNTKADVENKWIHISDVALSDGAYELRLVDTDGTVHDTQHVIINLDFVLPAPELVATSEGDISMKGELVFTSDQPTFYGNTYYGSTIVASFQSLLTSTSVIADNPEGDFEIRPPRKLEIGSHTLTLYAELPDGTRSTAEVIRFSIDPDEAAAHARQALLGKTLSLKNAILMLLLVNFGILTFEAWKESGTRKTRRRRIA